MVTSAVHHSGAEVAERESVAAIVRQLGGPSRVAEQLGVSTQAVCQWYTRGKAIPGRHLGPLWQLAHARKIEWVPPGFQGFRIVPANGDDQPARETLPGNELPVTALTGQAA